MTTKRWLNEMNYWSISAIAALAARSLRSRWRLRVSRPILVPWPMCMPSTDIRTAFGGRRQAAAASEGAAAAATGTGWATIKGQFVFDGTPPKMPPYAVTKDQATCAPGGKAPLQETLVVDSGTGGIKNVAVFLRDASRVHESAQPKSGDVVFDQKSCLFLTHVIGATVGQTLDIKNSDDVGHNTNIVGKKNTFNQTIPAGTVDSLQIAEGRGDAGRGERAAFIRG